MDENIQKFIGELEKSLAAETFVKMTLGNYKGAEAHLQKIFVRLVGTKKGKRLLFQFRYQTRDVVKNLEIAEALTATAIFSKPAPQRPFSTPPTPTEIGKRNSRLNPETDVRRPAAAVARPRQKK